MAAIVRIIRGTALMLSYLYASTAGAESFFTVEQVQSKLFPGASFSEQQLDVDRDFLKAVKKQTSMRLRPEEVQVWRAAANGATDGWLFVSEVLGKHENIRYALALDATGKVKGMEVMDYRETHGDEVREEVWRAQFFGRSLGDDLKLGRGIDNISGATLSCRHLTDGVHALLMVYDNYLKG